MKAKNPMITVLMPVYNGMKYIHEAIDSVLCQTFEDFELLIIDDCSTDKSVDIIKSYKDSRIRLIQNEKNFGITPTRNIGLANAKGEFIALLDCDDRSLPDRFSEQVGFLDKNPDYGMIGSWVEIIDEKGMPTGTVWKYDAPSDKIPGLLLFHNYFAQSSILIRRAVIPFGGYNQFQAAVEDYDMWIRIANTTKVWNLQKVLTSYRVHNESVSFDKASLIEQCDKEIISKQLNLIGIEHSTQELIIHREIHNLNFKVSVEFLNSAETWLKKLYDANNEKHYYEQPFYNNLLGEKWIMICERSAGLGLSVLQLFYSSQLSGFVNLSLSKKIRLWIKCLIKWHYNHWKLAH
jgi:glycosyltransferase involved in cell wall biosynthesis